MNHPSNQFIERLSLLLPSSATIPKNYSASGILDHKHFDNDDSKNSL